MEMLHRYVDMVFRYAYALPTVLGELYDLDTRRSKRTDTTERN